jgi:ankyrin repeat protein
MFSFDDLDKMTYSELITYLQADKHRSFYTFRDEKGKTLIHAILGRRDIPICDPELIKLFDDILYALNVSPQKLHTLVLMTGATPLHYIAAKNRVNSLKFLVNYVKEKRAKLEYNPSDNGRITPLIQAILHRNIDIIEELKKLDPFIVYANCKINFPLAVKVYDYVITLKPFENYTYYQGGMPLVVFVRFLLNYYENASAENLADKHRQAGIKACQQIIKIVAPPRLSPDEVKKELEKIAFHKYSDLNIRADHLETLFIENCIDPNVQLGVGTFIFMPHLYCDSHALRALLKSGVSPNVRKAGSKEGMLHCLAEYQKEERIIPIDFLLKHGADPNLQDASGDTPLIKLLKPGIFRRRTCQLLLEAGADIFKENNLHDSPFQLALKTRCDWAMELFLEKLETTVSVEQRQKIKAEVLAACGESAFQEIFRRPAWQGSPFAYAAAQAFTVPHEKPSAPPPPPQLLQELEMLRASKQNNDQITRISELEEQLNILSLQLTRTEEAYRELQTQINTNLNEKHLAVQADLFQQIEKLKIEIDSLRKEKALLSNKLSQAIKPSDYEAAQRKIANLEATVEDLHKQKMLDQASIDQVSIDLEKSSQTIVELTTDIKALEQEKEALKASHAAKQRELGGKLGTASRERKKLQGKLPFYKAQLQKALTEANHYKKENKELQERIARLSALNEQSAAAKQHLESEVERLTAKIHETEQTALTTQNQMQHKIERLEDRASRFEQAKANIRNFLKSPPLEDSDDESLTLTSASKSTSNDALKLVHQSLLLGSTDESAPLTSGRKRRNPLSLFQEAAEIQVQSKRQERAAIEIDLNADYASPLPEEAGAQAFKNSMS